MKNYFRTIKGEVFDRLSFDEQINFLISKKLFQVQTSVPLKLSEPELIIQVENSVLKVNPTESVIKDFHNYLLSQFHLDIEKKKIIFFTSFNDEIFGLKNAESYDIGLIHFKDKFKDLETKGIQFIKKVPTDSGVEHIANMNKFKYLKYRQLGMITNYCTFENIVQFLKGNQDFFNPKSVESLNRFNYFIEFEFLLQTLIALNDKYQFTNDFTYSKLGQLKEKYQKYSSIFITLELFVFVYYEIKSLRKFKRSIIESLYEALKQMDLVGGKKIDFIRYLKSEHKIIIPKIKKYSFEENRTHDFRVTQFKEKLKEFVAKQNS